MRGRRERAKEEDEGQEGEGGRGEVWEREQGKRADMRMVCREKRREGDDEHRSNTHFFFSFAAWPPDE